MIFCLGGKGFGAFRRKEPGKKTEAGQKEEIGQQTAPDFPVLGSGQVWLLLATHQKAHALIKRKVVPVALFPLAASKALDGAKGADQRSSPAQRGKNVAVCLTLKVALKKTEHKTDVQQNQRQKRQGCAGPGQCFRRKGQEAGKLRQERRVHDGLAGERRDQGETQGEGADKRRIPEQVSVTHMPDFMGNHAFQLLWTEVLHQCRSKEQGPATGQQTKHACGQGLPLLQRPEVQVCPKLLGRAKIRNQAAERAFRDRLAAPEFEQAKGQGQNQQNQRGRKSQNFCPRIGQEGKEPGRNQPAQAVQHKGSQYPGQNQRQILATLADKKGKRPHALAKEFLERRSSGQPTQGQQCKKGGQSHQFCQLCGAALQGQGVQPVLQVQPVEPEDKADKGRGKHTAFRPEPGFLRTDADKELP